MLLTLGFRVSEIWDVETVDLGAVCCLLGFPSLHKAEYDATAPPPPPPHSTPITPTPSSLSPVRPVSPKPQSPHPDKGRVPFFKGSLGASFSTAS